MCVACSYMCACARSVKTPATYMMSDYGLPHGAFSMAGSARVLAERIDLVYDCLKLEAPC